MKSGPGHWGRLGKHVCNTPVSFKYGENQILHFDHLERHRQQQDKDAVVRRKGGPSSIQEGSGVGGRVNWAKWTDADTGSSTMEMGHLLPLARGVICETQLYTQGLTPLEVSILSNCCNHSM